MPDHLPSAITRADTDPHIIRQIAHLIKDKGHAPELLCNGLGFSLDDLRTGNFKVSYRQICLFIQRAFQQLADHSLGLQIAKYQSVVSYGLPGLGMLTCPTLGAALSYLMRYQKQAGAFVYNQMKQDRQLVIFQIELRFYDPVLEPFFVEEDFGSGVALTRSLIGEHFRPMRLELSYPKPAYSALYQRFFQCPIVFDAPLNRLFMDAHWLEQPIRTYDEYMQPCLQAQIDSVLSMTQTEEEDLIESITTFLSSKLAQAPSLQETAQSLYLTERTLRRRLSALSTSYQKILDKVRYQQAHNLLTRTHLSLYDIAIAIGFSDAPGFRRAFKRWSGQLPQEIRDAAQAEGKDAQSSAL